MVSQTNAAETQIEFQRQATELKFRGETFNALGSQLSQAVELWLHLMKAANAFARGRALKSFQTNLGALLAEFLSDIFFSHQT